MSRVLGFTTVLLVSATAAFAGVSSTVPEIDASTAVGAVALIAGGLVVLRARRKK
ncbi:MAG TPA: LPXTG cell wall anchor domain-containing protein [Verrucomicrobiae bacterium]|nr:LPXTG cell wall anchor domain-containing protein [Verrucomicrobiae bacterium]